MREKPVKFSFRSLKMNQNTHLLTPHLQKYKKFWILLRSSRMFLYSKKQIQQIPLPAFQVKYLTEVILLEVCVFQYSQTSPKIHSYFSLCWEEGQERAKFGFLTITSKIMHLRKRSWNKSCRALKNEHFNFFDFFRYEALGTS